MNECVYVMYRRRGKLNNNTQNDDCGSTSLFTKMFVDLSFEQQCNKFQWKIMMQLMHSYYKIILCAVLHMRC